VEGPMTTGGRRPCGAGRRGLGRREDRRPARSRPSRAAVGPRRSTLFDGVPPGPGRGCGEHGFGVPIDDDPPVRGEPAAACGCAAFRPRTGAARRPRSPVPRARDRQHPLPRHPSSAMRFTADTGSRPRAPGAGKGPDRQVRPSGTVRTAAHPARNQERAGERARVRCWTVARSSPAPRAPARRAAHQGAPASPGSGHTGGPRLPAPSLRSVAAPSTRAARCSS